MPSPPETSPEHALIHAVRAGDLDAIAALLAAGADVNAHVDGMFRVVAHPGKGDRVAVVRLLLAHGADPHLPAYDDGSALDLWAYEGDAAVVQILLEHGADPNLGCAPSGETPLHYATGTAHREPSRTPCVAALLAAGADPNRSAGVGIGTSVYMRDVRVRGERPLHRAAIHGDLEMIQTLLDGGADPSLLDAHGESPLSWASRARRPYEILRLLLYGRFIGTMNW